MVSLRVANVLLICMSTLFAMALAADSIFMIHAYIGMLLAGQVVSGATRPEQRPKWAR